MTKEEAKAFLEGLLSGVPTNDLVEELKRRKGASVSHLKKGQQYWHLGVYPADIIIVHKTENPEGS